MEDGSDPEAFSVPSVHPLLGDRPPGALPKPVFSPESALPAPSKRLAVSRVAHLGELREGRFFKLKLNKPGRGRECSC